MTSVFSLRPGKFRLRKVAGLALAAVLSTSVVTAVAVQDSASSSLTAECDAFKSAATAAMNNHLTIVNTFMGDAQSHMQAAVSATNSCIGRFSSLDFDLSKLIPDFGLLGKLLDMAIDKLITGVINKACDAVVGVLDSGSSTWNGIMNTLTGQLNLNNQVQSWSNGIDYKIASLGTSSSSSSSTSYPTTLVDTAPLSCVPTLTGQLCSDGTTTTNTTTDASGNAVSASSSGTTTGAQLGAQFGALSVACSDALSGSVSSLLGSLNTPSACTQLQAFLNTNAAYIDRSLVPSYSGYALTVPSNIGSAISSTTATTGATTTTTTTPSSNSAELPVRN